MSFLDILKEAIDVSKSTVGKAVVVPGAVLESVIPPSVVSVPAQVIDDVAMPVLTVLAPKKQTKEITIEPITAPKATRLTVPGSESDKTTIEEIMELLPMAGLGLLAFLL